ncbi:MAG: two pore domain potassium channel family protein [Bacteroidales bacterium]|nr:two pore domain potassium channel family protein [Bacteroidales bacterium]
MNTIRKQFHHYRFEILFFSFMFLMFYSLIIPGISFSLILLLNVIAGINMFPLKRKKLVIPLSIAGASLITAIMGALTRGTGIVTMGFAMFVIFFILLAFEVFSQIRRSPKVNTGIIYGLFCGLIILGIMGALIFTIIEFIYPNSFSNINPELATINQLVYFSFITILTIGFGDIIPLTPLAQKSTMLFGLIGHFYTVVVIALVIGKYLANSMTNNQNKMNANE